jgi:hypothetical protein
VLLLFLLVCQSGKESERLSNLFQPERAKSSMHLFSFRMKIARLLDALFLLLAGFAASIGTLVVIIIAIYA